MKNLIEETMYKDEYRRQVRSREELLDFENEELKQTIERLKASLLSANERAERCPLTGFYNKDHFYHYLRDRVPQDVKAAEHASLLLLTVDNLEMIIHAYGYEEADDCLKSIAYLMKRECGAGDVLFRPAGTLFACYLQGADRARANILAETLINAVSAAEFFIADMIVSIGLCTVEEIIEEDAEAAQSDERLYSEAMRRVRYAKQKGRNMIVSERAAEKLSPLTEKILLVDTDEVNLRILDHSFKNLGYEVLVAKDGDQAYGMAIAEQPAVVIAELMLPKNDGFHLRRRLLLDSETKSIQFILMAQLKDDANVIRAAELGIQYYFKKPYMLSEVTGVVKNLMESRT